MIWIASSYKTLLAMTILCKNDLHDKANLMLIQFIYVSILLAISIYKRILNLIMRCRVDARQPEDTDRLPNDAAGLSEIKPFDKCMEEWIADYHAYTHIMRQHTSSEPAKEIDTECMQPALTFIMQRYRGFPCMPHQTYAQDGEITQAGVSRYLDDVLCYENNQSQCVIS